MTTDNIKQGTRQDFAYVESMGSAVRVGYGLTPVDGQEGQYKWHEVTLYKKQYPIITLQTVKDAIIADINARIDEKILNGYQFTPDGGEQAITVWLSKESQTNFSEAHRLQMVPVKFKLNEDEQKQPIYHTFTEFSELDRFYIGGVQYINQCLNEGWTEKDAIDWTPYEALFPATEDNGQQQEPAEE